jgi:nucleoside-diphosphate-sugar epimerase
MIIHCAYNSKQLSLGTQMSFVEHQLYLDDNVCLTERLAQVKTKLFVYISSIDVFNPCTPYAVCKRMAERVVIEQAANWIILRCGSLLWEGTRHNTFNRLYKDPQPSVSLTANSELNFVLYSDIYEIVSNNPPPGIYNLVSTENIMVSDIASMFLKNETVTYGDHYYKAPVPSEYGSLCRPENMQLALDRSSRETIELYTHTTG